MGLFFTLININIKSNHHIKEVELKRKLELDWDANIRSEEDILKGETYK